MLIISYEDLTKLNELTKKNNDIYVYTYMMKEYSKRFVGLNTEQNHRMTLKKAWRDYKNVGLYRK